MVEIWRLSDLPNLTKLTMNHHLLENITVDATRQLVFHLRTQILSVSSNLGKAASNDVPGTGWYGQCFGQAQRSC